MKRSYQEEMNSSLERSKKNEEIDDIFDTYLNALCRPPPRLLPPSSSNNVGIFLYIIYITCIDLKLYNAILGRKSNEIC